MRRGQQRGSIPDKANRILNLILVGMICLLLKVWHLAVFQRDALLSAFEKPSQRTILEPPLRGTISDRFGLPLAVNHIAYQAAIVYAQIKELPQVAWEKGEKIYKRRQHITRLSELLGELLDMDAKRVEDEIHSYSVFYDTQPFVIKEDITEEQYYRLKMLEQDWPGLMARSVPKRFYPRGRSASHLIGYTGAISRREYEAFLYEKKCLADYLRACEQGEEAYPPIGILGPEEAEKRLNELKELSYSISDKVGKTGIERQFEEKLKGVKGKKAFQADARGNFLHELDGSHQPVPGKGVHLTLSIELQEYCEKLLAENERLREGRSTLIEHGQSRREVLKQPWMKGGAVVAMDPNSGEVLAMASYPRFDPNDYVSGHEGSLLRWMETEKTLGEIWDQQRPMQRELAEMGGDFFDEEKMLTWDSYLDMVLPADSMIKVKMQRPRTLRDVAAVQKSLYELQKLSGTEAIGQLLFTLYPEASAPPLPLFGGIGLQEIQRRLEAEAERVAEIRKPLDAFVAEMENNRERTLALDLLKLQMASDLFSEPLLARVGGKKINDYQAETKAFVQLEKAAKVEARKVFHTERFSQWRQESGREFLKEKRKAEREKKLWAKPYLDYFDKEEESQFEQFWDSHRWHIMLHTVVGEKPSDPALAPFLCGPAPDIEHHVILKEGLKDLDPSLAEGYLQTMRGFAELTRPLYGWYRLPFARGRVQQEKDLALAFYSLYSTGYHRPVTHRQASAPGSVFKLVTAYESMIEQWDKGVGRLDPLEMFDEVYRRNGRWHVGYSHSKEPIPQVYKGGRIPRSAARSIGHVDMVKALERSSNPYFSLLAKEVLDDPENLRGAAELFGFGEKTGIELPMENAGSLPDDLDYNTTGLYAFAIGQHAFTATPLQAATFLSSVVNGGHLLKPSLVGSGQSRREIPLPKQIGKILKSGMEKSYHRIQKDPARSLAKLYQPSKGTYETMKQVDMMGKTSTTEVMERLDLDYTKGVKRYRNLWFSGAVMDEQKKPELVVVVLLRYGGYGREAVPIATAVAKKWREIRQASGCQ